MSVNRRIQTSDIGKVTVVRFMDRKILDEAVIQELGAELHALAEESGSQLLLNFSDVEFLSSAALGQLIRLDKSLKANGGSVKLCQILPQIYEVFALTKLDLLFDIHDDEASALASFGS